MSGPLSGLRLLIVEDEAIIAMTAEDMIEDMGGTVAASAPNLAAALDAVAAGGFDAAILDINLNGQMSLPVAAALRDANIPFLFTTGYGSAGPDDRFADIPVLKKPYDAEALGAALAALIRG